MPVLNFDYQNATRIIFGKGQIAMLPSLIPKDKKILMCYGGGSIKRNGVYDQVMTALKGYDITEFSGIEANPDYETLMKAVAIAKEMGTENLFVLSVGGGSVADGCKFICAAAVYTKSTEYYQDLCIEGGAKVDCALPLGVVLTLPATGSESNGNAVISYRAKHMKYCLASPYVYPKWAILDPETTYSLPARQTANGVVDSCVHVCEQYVTDCIDADVQDRYSEALLKVLIENGTKVMEDPNNYAVRANIMWAATQALNCWICQGVHQDWATHMIGHELTAYLGLDHAQTLACIQPRVFRYRFEAKKAKLAQMAERVFDVKEGTVEEKAEKAIELLDKFYTDVMKVPSRISQYGCSQDKAWIDDCVAKLAKSGAKFGENADILPEDVKTIILQSY